MEPYFISTSVYREAVISFTIYILYMYIYLLCKDIYRRQKQHIKMESGKCKPIRKECAKCARTSRWRQRGTDQADVPRRFQMVSRYSQIVP